MMLKCSKAKLFWDNRFMHMHRVCHSLYAQYKPLFCTKRQKGSGGLLVMNKQSCSVSQYKLANVS